MTEVFYQPRRSGKTTKMIEMSNKLNQIIIASNQDQAKLIASQAEDMGLIIPRPTDIMSYIRTTDSFNSRDLEAVLIDEAQMVLSTLLKSRITAMTITDWNDYKNTKGIIDELHKFNSVTVDEVALLKQTLTLKDKEIDRLHKIIDELFLKR